MFLLGVSTLVLSLIPCAQDRSPVTARLAPRPARAEHLPDGRWKYALSPGYYGIDAASASCHVHWRTVALAGKKRHLTLKLNDGKDGPNFLEETWYSAAGTIPRQVAKAALDAVGGTAEITNVQVENGAWYADVAARKRYILRLFSNNDSLLGSVGVPQARTVFGGYVVRNVSDAEFARASAGAPAWDEPAKLVATGDGALCYLNTPAARIGCYRNGAFTTYVLAPLAQPTDIAASPDNSVWFTDPIDNVVGRFYGGRIEEFDAGEGPWGKRQPFDVVAGAHGAAFFTEANSIAVGVAYPSGVVDHFLNLGNVQANDIPLGAGALSGVDTGGVWYAAGSAYGSILLGQHARRYATGVWTSAVAALRDGAWYLTPSGFLRVDVNGKALVQLTMDHPFPPYRATLLLDGAQQPCALWAARIACVHANRVQTQSVALSASAKKAADRPGFATRAADGTLWWTVPKADTVAHLRSDGTIASVLLPLGTQPTGIAAAADGSIWITETNAHRLAHVDAQHERLINEIPIQNGLVVTAAK